MVVVAVEPSTFHVSPPKLIVAAFHEKLVVLKDLNFRLVKTGVSANPDDEFAVPDGILMSTPDGLKLNN